MWPHFAELVNVELIHLGSLFVARLIPSPAQQFPTQNRPSSGDVIVINQYYAQRSRPTHPAKAVEIGRRIAYFADPRDRKIGTIPVGTILYILDSLRPLHVLPRSVVCREPWIVEAWLPREYAKWDNSTRRFLTVRIAGGHLAVVRSLRDRNRVKVVADWILLACMDAGLAKLT